jgi:DNA helicase-2/ATP-dependent DNA helicase PcrA
MSRHLAPGLKRQIKPTTQRRLAHLRRLVALSQKWLTIYNPDRFFNRVIRRFGYLASITTQNDISLINDLNCFYQELRTQSQENHLTLSQFLARIRLMQQNHLSLYPPALDVDTSSYVRLLTVHKAKGLEFEHVFIFKFLDKKWGNNRHFDSLRLPLGLVKTELVLHQLEDEFEDERRLFYVALTRAKKQIYLSYPARSLADKELLPSPFLAEIDPKKLVIHLFQALIFLCRMHS